MNRRAFSFLDILVSIGVVSLLCVGLLKMSALSYSAGVRAAAADAMLRELANFSNVFGRCDSLASAMAGVERRGLIMTGRDSESAACVESELSIRREGAVEEFTLEVVYAPADAAKGGGFSRTVSIRRIAQ